MSGQHPSIPPIIVLILGICAVSTGAIFAKLAQAPPLVVAAYRTGLASVLISPFVLVTSRKDFSIMIWKDFGWAVVSGAFLAMHFATWITSLSYTCVANSVVLVNTNPIWVAVLSPMITKETISKKTIIGIALSLIGVMIIAIENISIHQREWIGNSLALAGGLCAAIYLMIGKNIRSKLSLPSYILICYGSSAAILWMVILILNLQVTGFSSETFATFLAMAIIPQLIGHSCYNWSLKWLPTSIVAVSLLGEPIGSSILAYFIFHELITGHTVVGGILILSAIYLVASKEK